MLLDIYPLFTTSVIVVDPKEALVYIFQVEGNIQISNSDLVVAMYLPEGYVTKVV